MLKYVVFVAFSCALFSHTLLAEDKPAFPVVDGKYVVIERMLVKEGYEQWFEDYWKNMVLPVFAEIDGFEGGYMLANSALPTDPVGETDFGEILPMGPPANVFLDHGGIHLNGVQTDTQINFDAMLRGTYNYQVVHFWRNSDALKGLVPGLAAGWQTVHGEGDPWAILTEDYFPNLENHWDIVYRVVQ
tara:strand:+ start:7720 stop:8283 length:564 start_codon:yes stop_codon:yes gene_type:complete